MDDVKDFPQRRGVTDASHVLVNLGEVCYGLQVKKADYPYHQFSLKGQEDVPVTTCNSLHLQNKIY